MAMAVTMTVTAPMAAMAVVLSHQNESVSITLHDRR